MPDSKTEPKTEPGASNGMTQKDVEFIVACLQNANGGAVSVDSAGVAAALGYDNPRSVANRISTLKKKYNLPFGSTTGKASAAATGAASTKPAAPVKNKITKTKKETAPKKTPVKKSGKAPANSKKKATESDEEADIPEIEVEADEEMADAGPGIY